MSVIFPTVWAMPAQNNNIEKMNWIIELIAKQMGSVFNLYMACLLKAVIANQMKRRLIYVGSGPLFGLNGFVQNEEQVQLKNLQP